MLGMTGGVENADVAGETCVDGRVETPCVGLGGREERSEGAKRNTILRRKVGKEQSRTHVWRINRCTRDVDAPLVRRCDVTQLR